MYLLLSAFLLTTFIFLIIKFYFQKTYNGPYYVGSNMPARQLLYHDKLLEFEHKLSNFYPLGDDFFKIDHGKNYFAFFERMGELNMQVYFDNASNIIASGAGVLKNIRTNFNNSDTNIKAWYICDLKVDPKFRQNRFPIKMLLKTFLLSYIKSNKCYAITMNQSSFDKNNVYATNKIVRLANRIKIVNFAFKFSGLLYIYSVDYDKMKTLHDVIKEKRGSISYLSLYGIKDLILQSTNKPLNILHVQYNTLKNNNNTKKEKNLDSYTYLKPQKYCTHMFCCHENDELKTILDKLNIHTNVTASILQHGLNNCDWKFVQTSEI